MKRLPRTSLFKYEFQKLFCIGATAALIAALLFGSVLVCLATVNKDEKTVYSPDQQAVIRDFFALYANDAEGLAAFRERQSQAFLSLQKQLADDYTAALAEGADEKELEKRFSDPALFRTYLYSDNIDDAGLLAVFESMQAVKEAYAFGVGLILEQARHNASELREKYGMTPKDTAYRYQMYVYSKYDAVKNAADVGGYVTAGWEELFTFSYGDLFLFAALTLLSGAAFFHERQSGMLPLLRCAAKGRFHTSLAKIAALTVSAGLLTLLFSLCSFLCVGYLRGYSSPTVAVQNIKALTLFPEICSVWQYLLLALGLKLVSALAFTLVCALIAAAVRGGAAYYFLGGGFFGLNFFFGTLDRARAPALAGLNLFSVCNVLPVTERLYVFQPFTGCISYYALAPMLCLGVCLAAAVGGAAVFSGVRASGRSSAVLKKAMKAIRQKISAPSAGPASGRAGKRYRPSIFLWELRKMLFHNRAALALTILLFVLQLALGFATRIAASPSREYRLYTKFLLSETGGSFSEYGERYRMLLALYTAPENGPNLLSDLLANGKITPEEHARLAETLRQVKDGLFSDDFGEAARVFERNAALYGRGLDPVFIDETGVRPLVTGESCYPLYALLAVISAGAVLREYGGKSRQERFAVLLKSTRRGRGRTYRAKLSAGVCCAFWFSLLFNAAAFAIETFGRDLSCFEAPLYSVGAFAETGVGMKTGDYLLFVFAARLVIAMLFSVFVQAVAALTRDIVSAAGAILGLTLLPSLLYTAGLQAAGYVSFIHLLGVNGAVLFYGNLGGACAAMGAFAAVTALTAAAGRKFAK